MTTAQDLCYLPAVEVAAAIRGGTVSPVEIVEALLDRIERVNPRLNAFTVVLAEEARAAARQAEQDAARGNIAGPLHGVPFTIKDLAFTRGVPTQRGSKAWAGYVPEENSLIVDRLLAAGGIFLAKTTTPEFGNKGITESLLHGTTNNPWDTTRTAGGSSGGAAAAVAAGLGPLGHGSDGAGSIRIPASLCGVAGFKPSYGRVPSFPPSPFVTLAHQGPLTRTVADAALMLTAMAGPDDRDPYSLTDSGVDFVAALTGASVKGVRVAYSRDLGLAPVDPRVTALTDAAARLFADTLGARVDEVTPDLPNPEEALMTIWSVIMGANTADLILSRAGREDVDPQLLAFLHRAEETSSIEFQRAAGAFRGEFYRRMIEFFQGYELLLSPTLTTPPFPHPGWTPGPTEVNGQPINPMLGWLLTYPFNLTGQPAISVPCGFTDDGLPVGLQIAGRRHADAAVLRAAAAYEQAAPWAHRRPPLD
jgi:aspartyl-tRNA(Asn)/glutamyl-tRNA(Gln) amidotransferase subunit A